MERQVRRSPVFPPLKRRPIHTASSWRRHAEPVGHRTNVERRRVAADLGPAIRPVRMGDAWRYGWNCGAARCRIAAVNTAH